MEDTLIMDAVINKYFAGETSDREEQFLMAWLEESEEHRKYFFELKSIWNARNVFAESADLGRFVAFMRSTDARIAKIAGEERARRRRGLLRWSMSAAAAVLLVVCAGFAWHFLAGPDIYRVYENNTETVTTVTLDDGTQVWLNSESSLVFPVRFGDGPREVTVTGEAYFDVAHDEAHPFVVKTENLSVRVLGTAFNVRAHAADPLTEVVLERGSVRLQTPEGYNLVRLHPNQRAVFDAAKDDIEVEEIYAEHFVTERYNLVAMKNATIGEIIARIESNYGVRIRIADPDNRKRYDINYLRTNSLEEVIDIVEFMTGQRCEVVRGK